MRVAWVNTICKYIYCVHTHDNRYYKECEGGGFLEIFNFVVILTTQERV